MKKQFNDRYQLQAINHGKGPACVLAGPGSGKTFIITNRIQTLINSGIFSEKILVITFTRAAANEMKQRYLSLPDSKAGVIFGTFHSIYYQFLKQFYKNFSPQIIESQIQHTIINNILSSSEFIPLNSQLKNDSYDDLLSAISFYKTTKSQIPIQYSEQTFIKFYNAYEEAKKAAGYIDYDDILIDILNLLTINSDFRNSLMAKYEFILIDEFQDINLLQYETIKLILNSSNNIFVVGDDDQSIYGFRGSCGDIFNTFIKDFPNAVKIELPMNYRSSNDILQASQKLIKNNLFRIKTIDLSSFNKEKGIFKILPMKNYLYENQFIEKMIDKCTKEKKSIGILVRTNKDVYRISEYLERNDQDDQSLINTKIRNSIYSDIEAYVSFTLNRDRKSILRLIRVPERYLPREMFMSEIIDLDNLTKKYRGDIKANQLSVLNKQISLMAKLSPFSFLTYLMKIVGYEDFLKTIYKGKQNKYAKDVLDELLLSSKSVNSLAEFYEYIKSSQTNIIKHEKYYSLLTFHSSKGLEFDVVVLPCVNEGHIPGREAILTKGDVEEERRLFYVAMTRAKEELYITYIQENDSMRLMPSRFIKGLTDK